MRKKEVIIVIPGSKYIKSRKKFIQKLILLGYKFTRIFNPVYHNYGREWRYKFDSKEREVMWLHWGRGITIISRFFAIRRLRKLLRKYKSRKVKLIGISLGGDIGLEALKKEKMNSVEKIILIGSTNKNKKLKINTRIINIYSKDDVFAKLATKFISPISGGQKLYGKNVLNIHIPNMTHDKFCADSKIGTGKYKGKRITELINYYLK